MKGIVMRTMLLIVAVISSVAVCSQQTHAQSVSARRVSPSIKLLSQATPSKAEVLRISGERLSLTAPPHSDLQASLTVTYNKETKKFLVKGRVINLGPDPFQEKNRRAHLRVTSGVIPKPDKACEKCANVVGSANTYDLKIEQIPALTISGGAGKFYTTFDISAEVERKEDDEKNAYTYYFEIYLDQSQSDLNQKNDKVGFAASNIGRGQ
jgi:hypothetical protein